MESTMVKNMRTGVKVFYGLTPKDAVKQAVKRYEKNNPLYENRDVLLNEKGNAYICGDWIALLF